MASNLIQSPPEAAEADEPKQSWLVSRGILLERGPRRTLAVASFVNMIGSGVFMIAASLFFTRSVGLSIAQVGIGLGIGELIGLLSGVPVGRLADKRGAREVYVITLLIQGLAMAALVLVHSFWLFVVVVSLTELAGTASQSARGPLVRNLAGKKPALFRAYLRSTANLAASIGAVLASVVVQLDTHEAYLALVVGNALSYLITAAVVWRLPSLPINKKAAKADRWMALKDTPYLMVTVLDGIMSLQGQVLVFALPLWIVLHTHAPRWFVGPSVLINTALVIALQVRASRNVEGPGDAARVWRRSGLAFLAGMVLISVTGGLPAWAAIAVITLGVAVHTFGELWQAAGSFELRYLLAPAHAQGQYTGVFKFGSGIAGVAAPSLLGFLCVTWGAPGWLVLGGTFLLAGLVMPPVVRWAERTRPEPVAD